MIKIFYITIIFFYYGPLKAWTLIPRILFKVSVFEGSKALSYIKKKYI